MTGGSFLPILPDQLPKQRVVEVVDLSKATYSARPNRQEQSGR